MQVSDAMTTDVRLISPDAALCEAARLMSELDIGALPVAEDDRLVGMLTDRDIVVRAVAQELSPHATVRQVMSPEVLYCFADQDLDEVADNMSEEKIRRLPVLDRDKRLVGIISLGDLALMEEEATGRTVADISEPGGEHSGSRH